ncbi:MAG: hypothetical protein ACXWZU_07005 [Actinomycetota bacterium]
MEIDLGFALVAEDMEGAQMDLSDLGPAAVIPIDQDTWFEPDERFQKGDHAGWVHGTAILTHRDRLVCHLTFSFEDHPEDSIAVHGVLPRDGAGLGRGRMAVTGGTGKFHKAAGTVEYDFVNPKRYGFTL